MYTCASCTVLACANNEPDKMPKNCPMRNTSVMENSRDGYDLPENYDFDTYNSLTPNWYYKVLR